MGEPYLTFRPSNDNEIRGGLRRLYTRVRLQSEVAVSVLIELPTTRWVSAASLNMLVTFVAAVHFRQPDARIYVQLIDQQAASAVLSSGDASAIREDERTALSQKLVFYDAVGLVRLLNQASVMVRPSRAELPHLQRILDAKKTERKFQYSTRMLSLSPLIESEVGQYELTTRIRTLTGILYKNLYQRIDLEQIRTASDQIMFELVKNIYQHSELPEDYRAKARGFACAQINKRPLIESDEFTQDVVNAVLDHVKPRIKGKRRRWLSISINDFGVGLAKSVANTLEVYLQDASEVRIGRFGVDGERLGDAALMIEIAATTDFSRKTVRSSRVGKRPSGHEGETWAVGKEELRLAEKGYGLVFCVGFMARTFGRMRVRAGQTALDIFPRPDTTLGKKDWDNVQQVAVRLQNSFVEDFRTVTRDLPEDERTFPGTQIIIEIPVEAWVD